MKNFILLFFFISFLSSAQNKKLFFKTENDSIISVIDEKGNIIIEPFISEYHYNNNEEIQNGIIYISLKKEKKNYYVNREGKFLFYSYNNKEPDTPKEYSIRFSDKNGKTGIADLAGNILIPAKYDYVCPFNFGFVYYCQECYFDREKDTEYPSLTGAKTFGYLDRNGKEITVTDKKKNNKDTREEHGKYIPYQFSYNDFEKKILQKLKKNSEKINRINISEGDQLTFEIIKRPDQNIPYYFIKLYRFQENANFSTDNDDAVGFNFYADETGNIFVHHYQRDGNDYKKILVPLDEWLKHSDD
ncbi:WG repeat-containing protein [Chryseobacterium populi]|uniref:WG repeat-containing protein n=1 Tax=Chryseobacterium populi TaxID=1144316 RepID=UPI0012F47974|nr:WG repeat-containing protein [Chryseobacterium populi]